jgi:hypothetical protein
VDSGARGVNEQTFDWVLASIAFVFILFLGWVVWYLAVERPERAQRAIDQCAARDGVVIWTDTRDLLYLCIDERGRILP